MAAHLSFGLRAKLNGEHNYMLHTTYYTYICIHLIMAALWNRADHYIFALWFLYSFFFSSPNLSGCRLDIYHTSTHGVALVRI